jgi:hypothetical protein
MLPRSPTAATSNTEWLLRRLLHPPQRQRIQPAGPPTMPNLETVARKSAFLAHKGEWRQAFRANTPFRSNYRSSEKVLVTRRSATQVRRASCPMRRDCGRCSRTNTGRGYRRADRTSSRTSCRSGTGTCRRSWDPFRSRDGSQGIPGCLVAGAAALIQHLPHPPQTSRDAA